MVCNHQCIIENPKKMIKRIIGILLLTVLSFSLVEAQPLKNVNSKLLRANGKLVRASSGFIIYSSQGATNSQVTLILRMSTGKSVVINWGDGKTSTASATSNTPYASSYSLKNQTFPITITGNLDGILRFECTSVAINLGNFTCISLLTNLLELSLANGIGLSLNINNISSTLVYFSSTNGNLPMVGSLSNLPNLAQLLLNTNGAITGILPSSGMTIISVTGSNLAFSVDITNNTGLTILSINASKSTVTGDGTNLVNLVNCSLYKNWGLTADISGWVNLTIFYNQGNPFSGSLTNLTHITSFYSPLGTTPTAYSGICSNMPISSYFFIAGDTNTVGGVVSNWTNATNILVSGNGNTIGGSTSGFSKLTYIALSGSSLTFTSIDLSSSVLLTNVVITGIPSITSITNPTHSLDIAQYDAYSNSLTSLDISGLSNLSTTLRGYSNTGLTTLSLPTINRQFTTVDFHNCALNTVYVDAIFAKLNAWYSTHTPTAGLTIELSGGTNSRPTGGNSNTDLVNLQSIFASTGKLLSVYLHP